VRFEKEAQQDQICAEDFWSQSSRQGDSGKKKKESAHLELAARRYAFLPNWKAMQDKRLYEEFGRLDVSQELLR